MAQSFTKNDVTICKNLMSIVKRAKYDLDGDEIMAFAQTMNWVAKLYERIVAESGDVPPAPTAERKPQDEKKPAEQPTVMARKKPTAKGK